MNKYYKNISNITLKNLLWVSVLAVSASCSLYSDRPDPAKVEELSLLGDCEKVSKLIASHQQLFEGLKTSRKETAFGEIYNVKYHLIGDKCKIYKLENDFSYSCNVNSKDQDLAMTRFNNGISRIEACLDDSWQKDKKSIEPKIGEAVIYRNKSTQTVISLQTFEAPDRIVNRTWLNYIFVGNEKNINKN